MSLQMFSAPLVTPKSLRSVRLSFESSAKSTLQQFDTDFKVHEVMKRQVITLKPSDSCKMAVKTFLDQHISGAPVIDPATHRLVGVLTESDLIVKEQASLEPHWIIPPIYVPFFDSILQLQDAKTYHEEMRRMLSKTVGEAMTNEPITAREDMSLQEAAQLMVRHHVTRLPIVDKEGKLVGIVTRADVLRAMVLGHNLFLE